MVEHHLAKVRVAGSNPVSRSKTKNQSLESNSDFLFNRRRSQVAKAEVCKTSIHRFKSDRRLFLFLFISPSSGGLILVDAVI